MFKKVLVGLDSFPRRKAVSRLCVGYGLRSGILGAPARATQAA